MVMEGELAILETMNPEEGTTILSGGGFGAKGDSGGIVEPKICHYCKKKSHQSLHIGN